MTLSNSSATNTYILTGVAGFIGSEVAIALLQSGHRVIGIDNINDYYDTSLKFDRLARINALDEASANFTFHKVDLVDADGLNAIFAAEHKATALIVINLAAQAGVRNSIDNPADYIQSNLVGFANILECCRHFNVKHLAYASSSSVYGANIKTPFAESDSVDNPVSLYAATKKSNELLAHSYAHLYDIPVTGLRFFTVYGPWGRPDMAYFLFAKAILAGEPIKVFNHGNMLRDFTYIDDIVEGVVRVANKPPQAPDINNVAATSRSKAPYKVYNIGNNQPEKLMDFISILESELEHNAQMDFQPMVMGDVKETFADIDQLSNDFDFRPKTSLADGLAKFVSWYKQYYKV